MPSARRIVGGMSRRNVAECAARDVTSGENEWNGEIERMIAHMTCWTFSAAAVISNDYEHRLSATGCAQRVENPNRLIDSSRRHSVFVRHPSVLVSRAICIGEGKCDESASLTAECVKSGSKNFGGRVAGEAQRWKSELATDESGGSANCRRNFSHECGDLIAFVRNQPRQGVEVAEVAGEGQAVCSHSVFGW